MGLRDMVAEVVCLAMMIILAYSLVLVAYGIGG
jgi:hypothetical protein